MGVGEAPSVKHASKLGFKQHQITDKEVLTDKLTCITKNKN